MAERVADALGVPVIRLMGKQMAPVQNGSAPSIIRVSTAYEDAGNDSKSAREAQAQPN